MKTIYESSKKSDDKSLSLVTYKNLNNISHYHDDFELVYIARGSAEITVNATPFKVTEGDCVFIHSNDIHRIESDSASVISVMKLDSKYFESLLSHKRLITPLLRGKYEVAAFLENIKKELKANEEYCNVIIDASATVFLARMMRGEETAHNDIHSPKSSFPNELTRKIISEYGTVTFDEAADFMHFSRPYFSKFFHSYFGMTFTEYLNTIRIAIAVDKIKEGKLTITQISAKCGYNTIRNFNRVFKKYTGYSPSELPDDYTFINNLRNPEGLDPTLNCSEIVED